MNLDCIDKKFDFTGSKIALICGDKVLTILRDDKDDIPCPNMLRNFSILNKQCLSYRGD